MAVRRELHLVSEAPGYVLHEGVRIAGVPTADHPANDQLRVRVQRSPPPSVTGLLRSGLGARDVLLLGVGEVPNLVGLDAPGLHSPHRAVVEFVADAAGVNQELQQAFNLFIR